MKLKYTLVSKLSCVVKGNHFCSFWNH